MIFDLIILTAIVLLIVVGASVILRVGRQHSADWEIEERSIGNGIEIQLVKRGQTPLCLGQAVRGDGFDMALAELRAEARSERADLNGGRKLL